MPESFERRALEIDGRDGEGGDPLQMQLAEKFFFSLFFDAEFACSSFLRCAYNGVTYTLQSSNP